MSTEPLYTATFPDSAITYLARNGADGPVSSVEFLVGGQRVMACPGASDTCKRPTTTLLGGLAAANDAGTRECRRVLSFACDGWRGDAKLPAEGPGAFLCGAIRKDHGGLPAYAACGGKWRLNVAS